MQRSPGSAPSRLVPSSATWLLFAITLASPAGKCDEPWFTQFEHERSLANAACQEKRYEACAEGLRNLLPLVDGRPDIQCVLAAVQARLGDQEAAANSFRLCARSQLNFGALMSLTSLQTLRALPAVAAIERDGTRRSVPHGEHRVHFKLTDPDLIAEDIAYDATDGSFLVSSVRQRKIVRVDANGVVSDFVTSARIPTWGLFALVLDSRRQVLWASTAAVPHSPPYSSADDGHSAVLRIDLRSRTLLGRYELDDGKAHAFGDMTLGLDGSVFVADGRGGGVYAARAGHQGLEVIVPPGNLRSPQTPALSADGRLLLVPDYTRGIALVRLSNHELTWLQHTPELALFGLDGFYWRGHTLIGVQNGTTPERILVMSLSTDCTRVTSWHVALAQVSGLGDPTHGLLRGRDFYFLANSGWDRFDDDGKPSGGGTAAAEIWRLQLPADVLAPAACGAQATGRGNGPSPAGAASARSAEIG